jgi:stage II sporulation protein R
MAAALVILTAFASIDSFARQCAVVRGETLRLHIIADSDGEEAQRNKLLVRDAILEQYSPMLSAGGDAETAEKLTDFCSTTSSSRPKRRCAPRAISTR